MKHLTLFTISTSALIFSACGDKASTEEATTAPAVQEVSNATPVPGSIALITDIPAEETPGTPHPISVPNLETPLSKAPVLLVPEGTTLLSAGKAVTASDDFPNVGDLAYITDGDKQTGDGYFVELMDGAQWVQIDLEAPAKLHAIWLWHYHFTARVYHDVIVQISNDPEFASGVTTLFNNDYDNSAEQGKGRDKPYVDTHFGKLVNAKGISAQYVRLYSNGNTFSDMNHYIEVEVHGIAK